MAHFLWHWLKALQLKPNVLEEVAVQPRRHREGGAPLPVGVDGEDEAHQPALLLDEVIPRGGPQLALLRLERTQKRVVVANIPVPVPWTVWVGMVGFAEGEEVRLHEAGCLHRLMLFDHLFISVDRCRGHCSGCQLKSVSVAGPTFGKLQHIVSPPAAWNQALLAVHVQVTAVQLLHQSL
eukprot:CAMPEP_0206137496 /NCGR_PEP_ID=MMETSP1473-20131121/2618_1 /ASSEMBLY_ACC=CAM_ASM_001109 /TAXON_ID=1461547 /ORGANISM="Stichococcus sp, Strain RCC1054" /LENGTH=179 /DNA_ID=CAMNT_0053530623 /DNA_START=3475 /DNA_END=4014 /DNA_ORIENTATION=-